MGLKEQITEDMKAAMRAKDTQKLGTIRMLTAAMKQKEVDERVELTDALIIGIIDKMIKRPDVPELDKLVRKPVYPAGVK